MLDEKTYVPLASKPKQYRTVSVLQKSSLRCLCLCILLSALPTVAFSQQARPIAPAQQNRALSVEASMPVVAQLADSEPPPVEIDYAPWLHAPLDSDPLASAGVYGTITSVGSDTLASLMALWAEAFQLSYPHVRIQIQATGSSTASQALTQGTATIGPMSRQLSLSETGRFSRRYGYSPTVLEVAVDAIAIFVEKNNPLNTISREQIDAVFSPTRYCGAAQDIRYWTDLGVEKFGANKPIVLFGRNSASGTYDLFKQQALCEGDYKVNMNELPGSSPIVLSISSSVGGMGYAAVGHSIGDVKALSISTQDIHGNADVVAPNVDNITSGRYPFTRPLYIVVNKTPGEPLPILERAFLDFILSDAGQEIVVNNGYYPITQRKAMQQRQMLAKP